MALSELSSDGLKELAGYLKEFPAHDEDADQYWHELACTLRKRYPRRFSHYSPQFLVTVGQRGDKAAFAFLMDLKKSKVDVEELLECLKEIKCQPAINFFMPGATKPELLESLESQHQLKLDVGDTLNLVVEATCRPGPLKYKWICNQKTLPNASSAHLTIPNVTTADTGTYHCKVTNPAINDPERASTLSQPVEVVVYNSEVSSEKTNGIHRQETYVKPPPPVITKHPTSITVRRNQPATFYCKAEEGVVYDWYKDGKQFRKGCRTGQLVIDPVKSADEGLYDCIVFNDGGNERSTAARLTFINSNIEITQQPCSQTLQVNNELKLSCTAHIPGRTDSQLEYEWYPVERNKPAARSLGKGQVYSTRVGLKDLTARLKLKFCCKVTDLSDSTNFVYSENATITVKTVWIVEEPCDLNAQISYRAQLSCKGKGEGNLVYRWLKSNTPEGTFKHHEMTKCGVLSFNKVAQKHEGYYQCVVENHRDHVTSRVAYLKPTSPNQGKKTSSYSIEIIREPRSLVVKEGAPFRMVFKAVSSAPTPISYQWYFSGTAIHGATSNIYKREAKIEDYGSYWCEAKVEGTSVVSEAARIELADNEIEHPGDWEQREAERIFKTSRGERFAREKVALLIGNARYQHKDFGELNTPESDIKELEKVLKAPPFNFKVFSLVDLTYSEMQSALLKLLYELLTVSGIYALFYFSGHGFQSNTHDSYLVPVDSEPCREYSFHVEDIVKRMQGTYSRAFLILDACQVVDEKSQDQNLSLSSMENFSSVLKIQSCIGNTTASDASEPSTSVFNKAFINVIKRGNKVSEMGHDILKELRNAGALQTVYTGGLIADRDITLKDSIMSDNLKDEDEEKLYNIPRTCQKAHKAPDGVILKGADMGDLNTYAELELTFSSVLTNILHVEAHLYQHQDKTTSAAIKFNEGFLHEQGVSGSQTDLYIDKPNECTHACIVIKGLQKLKAPLKLLIDVQMCVSGKDRKANLTHSLKDLPYIATICNS